MLRLSDQKGTHYFLKRSTHQGAVELGVLEALATTKMVPQVIAASVGRTTFIMGDHGGLPPRTSSDFALVLDAAAALEARNARKPLKIKSPRIIDALDDLRALQDLLADDTFGLLHGADIETVSLWHWVVDLLSRNAAFFRSLLAETQLLPRTLSHCDLHASNTGVREDGTVVIADWADAASGPAGTGLATMLDPFDLAGHLETRNSRDRGNPVVTYIDALAQLGYCSKSELSAAMRGTTVLGYLRSALDLVQYHEPDDTVRARFLASRIASASAGALIVGLGLRKGDHDEI